MKTFLICLLLINGLVSFSQDHQTWEMRGDTLVLPNGAKFWVGQKIQIGYGSNAMKGFEFIRLSPYALADAGERLDSKNASFQATVRDFKAMGNKKIGKKAYLVLGVGNFLNYWCDVFGAIESKEIIVPGVNDKKAAAAVSTQSLGDELKKLKDLFDSGALTKEEYEAAKKKLIQ